ncbi:hypothetical protein TNCV_924961 [Trichonephila clavipes]|nr:hypothetical protein TNCV_924961 [Trichonephila clavipes]
MDELWSLCGRLPYNIDAFNLNRVYWSQGYHRGKPVESMTGVIMASRCWTQALVASEFRRADYCSSAPVECK